jgi:SAM-dependent methyltransferase
LIETVIAAAGLEAGDRILEIGSGSGKATVYFAELGCQILCLEPGANLAALAARKFSDFPDVRFETNRFENWETQERAFDLVMSAQAFHWVPEDIGYAKAAKALKPGGHLALFWNMYPNIDNPLRRDLDRAYRRHAPEIAAVETDLEPRIEGIAKAIINSGHFYAPRVQRYPWSRQMTEQSYLGLLNTYSDHLRLEESRRKELLSAIANVIDKHGGLIEQNYLAVLYLARLK